MELEADLAHVGPGRLDPVVLDDGAEEGVEGKAMRHNCQPSLLGDRDK